MIQIYSPDNADFEKNGDMTLLPTSCELACEINGTWELTMSHPLDAEGRWKYIEQEAVIACPTFQGDKQLFRVDKCVKTESSVEITAYPVFFDSADDCFLMDIRPTQKNGQEALDIMTSGSKYSGQSNIMTTGTAYFVRRNLMDAINGKDSPTFVQAWGGEILFDNYTVVINQRIGGDYGADIRYGKNMNGLSYTVDMSDVVTRIIPVAYNGRMISGEAPWVDSENINTYVKKYIREVKFEDVKLSEDADSSTASESDIICQTQTELNAALTQKCEAMYAAGADLPAVTIKVNMVDLEHTEQYKDFTALVKIALGDTVHCRNIKLGITTEARVISLKWDCIRNQSVEMTLGDYEYNYFEELTSNMQAVNQIIGPGNTVIAERVSGVLNAINTQLRYQKNVAQKQDVRAILFEDTDLDSPTYGAMCIGTQGFQIADTRTADGRDWNWKTAFTAKGGYADVIIAGFMLADRIHGGTLTLGGVGNGNGVCQVMDAGGSEVVKLDNAGVKILKGLLQIGSLFSVDTAGNVIANSLKSSNAEITGGNINIETESDDYSAIMLKYGAYVLSLSASMMQVYEASNPERHASLYCGSGGSGGSLGLGYQTGSEFFIVNHTNLWYSGPTAVFEGDLHVYGNKNRVVKTDKYGERALNAYETTEAWFGDIGNGKISDDGKCTIEIDRIFAETVKLDDYVVFLQAEGPGECYINEKNANSFVVTGSPGLRFVYEIKAKQKGFEKVRLEEYKERKA